MRTRPVVLLALVAAMLLPGTPTAATDEVGAVPGRVVVPAGVRGADLSWPNCPTGMGVPGRRTQGLPLPWASARFWIVGLTNGRAFTRNPCLARHLRAARSRGVPVAAYTMLSYPNAAERRRHGASGPFGTATHADRIANVGYAQAAFALDTMATAGLAAPLVWIDVEPRRERPWSRNVANNRALITGAVRAATDRGIATGIYTYARAWAQITGGMQVDLPLWAPGHSRARTFAGKQAETLASCTRTSFTGGPLVLTQWVWRDRDHNITCPGIESVPTAMWAAPAA